MMDDDPNDVPLKRKARQMTARLAKRIREWLRAGFLQREIAAFLGIDQRVVSMVATGKLFPEGGAVQLEFDFG
jgi:predicted XRE-type DNA-binding protein